MEQWRVIASRHYSTRPSETCSDFAPLEKKLLSFSLDLFVGLLFPPKNVLFINIHPIFFNSGLQGHSAVTE